MKKGFNGLRVAAFESRRAGEIEELILACGGKPSVAPSVREEPMERPKSVWDFAGRLFDGQTDVLILLTATGVRIMSELIIKRYGKRDYIRALRRIKVVCRGPKTVAALAELGISPSVEVKQPATWRETVAASEEAGLLAGARVDLQQSGARNIRLMRALKSRGANVRSVFVYKWAFPSGAERPGAVRLEEAARSVAEGRRDAAVFTSSRQVVNFFEAARRAKVARLVKKGLSGAVVASVGPSTTETLEGFGVSVDYEPDATEMGALIEGLASRAAALLEKKTKALSLGIDTLRWKRTDMVWSRRARPRASRDSVFMRACRLEPAGRTPVWIMRQAGRYLRQYRRIRADVPFLDLCKNPELAAEVSLMPVDMFGFDAAIIFADILLILEPLGVGIEFSKGDGPRIKNTVRSAAAVDRMRDFDPEEMGYVCKALETARRALSPQVALLGFAGAPFTVASYMIEGGASSTYANTKALMRTDPGLWDALMSRLAVATASHLNAQIAAGADAVQLFDSWAGCLSPDDYRRFVLPYSKAVFRSLPAGVPAIHFGVGAGSLLGMMKEAGGNVIGVDWTVDLADAWKTVGYKTAVQGNLDPSVMVSERAVMEKNVAAILKKAGGRPGHIFNLGHGIPPSARAENVLALVDKVRELSSR